VGYTDKVFLKEYDIQQNEHFIQYVFLPYFKDIFKDLSARSDKPQEGINRLVFLDVSDNKLRLFRSQILTFSLLVHEPARHLE
jgi:hypothetical protein